MPNKEEKRITEQSSLYEHLEKMSVDELTAHINAENKKVALAIEQALPAINQLISAIEGQLTYTNQGIKRRRPGEWLAPALR